MCTQFLHCQPLVRVLSNGWGRDVMLLSQDELVELTGYKYPSKQIAWLRVNRFPFTVGGDRRPKVLRTAVVCMLGGVVEKTVEEPTLRLN